MADVLVEDKNGFSVNRNMTDSRDSSFSTADESRISMTWEANGFGSKTPVDHSRYIDITFIRKPRYPNMVTLHIVNTVLTLNSHRFLIRISL